VNARGEPLLRATGVVKQFPLRFGGRGGRVVHAVNGISMEVMAGETVGIVGESGCGKSTFGRCLVRLTDLTDGTVEFNGRNITTLSRRRLRPIRRDLQFVFQDPYASLNPRRRAGDIVADPLHVHDYGNAAAIRRRTEELFDVVGLSRTYVDRYPHEFSGGQRQRIGIARALAMNPRLIVADEPVSALDVSIQAQVLNLFADLQDEFGLTYIFIAHDLGVVRHVSSRIAVMYLGEIVELAEAESLYAGPAHPYAEALLSAVPQIDDGTTPRRERITLVGDVPSATDRPTGCAFHPRCRYAQDRCRLERPALRDIAPGRQTACHFPLLAPGEVASHP
jgi:oligopeptide/dipeptide ABC transporter ATP-binding protein